MTSEIDFPSRPKIVSLNSLNRGGGTEPTRLSSRLSSTYRDDVGSLRPDNVREILRGLIVKRTGRARRSASAEGARESDIELSAFLLDASQTLLSNAERLALVHQPASDCFVPVEQAQQIALLVFEVIQNALKYAHPTGLVVHVTLECLRSIDGCLVVRVSDDGVGLPERMDPYREGGAGFRRIRALAKNLKAELRIESDPLGSTFAVTLPKTVESSEISDALPEASNATDAPDRGTKLNGTPASLGEGGDHAGATNLLVDVSEHDRVGALQQFLAAIVESSDDAILSKNLDGIITSWNAGCERLFGYTAEEIIGRSVTILIPEDRKDEEPSILARLRRGEKIDHYETVRRRKDGSLLDISLTVSPIRGPDGTIVGGSKIARDITERKLAAAQQTLMLGEMKHRLKNLSAVIEALARQSRPRDAPAVDAFVDAFMGRVRALLSTGELMLGSPKRNVELKQLLDKVLLPFVDPNDTAERIVFEGPPLILTEKTAGNLALAIHELATNATKYGALKASHGKVRIAWSIEPMDGDRRVQIDWRETGGEPIAIEPERIGFGSRVIASALASERNGTTEMLFKRDGLHCRFRFFSSAAQDA